MNMIKKIAILLLLMISVSSAFAVEFRSVGSNADFNVYTFEGRKYLILSFKDDSENRLTNYTIVKFMLSDGSVLTLDGTSGSSSVDSGSTSFYNGFGFSYSIGSSEEKHYAILPITEEQIESLKKGVERVAINTIPKVYKRSKWSGKKSFGQNLYNDFQNLKDEMSDEESNGYGY